MPTLTHDGIAQWAQLTPDSIALHYQDEVFSYAHLYSEVSRAAQGLLDLHLNVNERVAVYLPKRPESIFGIFGASMAGCVFVPINPLLKARQVAYLLRDCNVRVLITSDSRLLSLVGVLDGCPDLQAVVSVDRHPSSPEVNTRLDVLSWQDFTSTGNTFDTRQRKPDEMGALLYTSGSSGPPKGVMLSHGNIVAGARIVTSYLQNDSEDRLLAALPLSFDYGLNQVTTALSVGASVTLMDYLLPLDIVQAVVRYGITGLAGVPSLWIPLATFKWPDAAIKSLRYITNTGGKMPKSTTLQLREQLPETEIYLMYGLTEAFRSTYLSPNQIEHRPDSIGRPVPETKIDVVREDGSLCNANEPGELVHRGPLVSLGYWNNPQATADKFKPAPAKNPANPTSEIAVWSGDSVMRDDEGYLYFIARKDEMIKTSGYRVSPSEVEEVLYDAGLVEAVVAVGVSHHTLGQAIIVVVKIPPHLTTDKDAILQCYQAHLPPFMVPKAIVFESDLPKNSNGKFDRRKLQVRFKDFFKEAD